MLYNSFSLNVYLCVCMRACVRACVPACVCTLDVCLFIDLHLHQFCIYRVEMLHALQWFVNLDFLN